ncbi:unnamed protein product [Arabis nemorensis]|uniref:Ubiquitin-like protease family profile domain-containing protein n=1 Tax=Arabis nemorensis TaxID=586526 RepID=A0A565AXQ0_9BRAS|nr:unnamed protein product [Arabis nemorensis]
MHVAPATVVSRGTKTALPATDDENEDVEETTTLPAKKTPDVIPDKVINKFLAKLKSDSRNVDTFYVPMLWGEDQWVDISISLSNSTIIVLNPFMEAVDDKRTSTLLKPLLQMIHVAVTDLGPGSPPQWPFQIVKESAAPQTNRLIDSGPMAVKIIEAHYQDLSLLGITQENVDNIRIDIHRGNLRVVRPLNLWLIYMLFL